MTQVSKRFVSKDIQQRIFEVFWESISLCKNKDLAASFLEDLLTPTEKIMLAKRVSIAFLLLKGYDYEAINQTLKVSDQTIWSVKVWLKSKGQGYRKILDQILTGEKWEKFWNDLDDFIGKILSPTPGKGVDWRNTRKREWVEKMARQKTF